MATFLKDLRRRSKASFRTARSTDESSSNDTNNGFTPSTSTLNSESKTPPLINSNSAPNLAAFGSATPLPFAQRPTVHTSSSNRYSAVGSVSGMSGLGAPAQNSSLPSSPYAPRVTSIADNTWVSQKILSVYGVIADPAVQALEGCVTVRRADDGFPSTDWPVCESHFKTLIYLMPGPNKLRFDYTSPKLASNNTTNPIHSSHITLHMIPPLASPPLQLVILMGQDSPGMFDACPQRVEKEGNTLETAIQKFRMAAYLWQAFTAEQMHRNKLGRRCWRIDEEWTQGTASIRDQAAGVMRSEARIHVIRCAKTVAELRDLDIAQQNPLAKNSGELFSIALEAVKDYFKPLPGQKQYVSALLLDAHWDKTQKIITGHAALGGGSGDIQLAICGSHALQSYPRNFEEVVLAFTDCTPTDTNYVANDCDESGSSWEAANVGIGAHLHETGHLFGCPHQESGVMLRDYVTFSRSFLTRECYSTRSKSKGGLVLQTDECTWHRLDLLRFRAHPSFALPGDPPRHNDDSVQAWPVDNGIVLITAPSGIAYIEIYPEGEELCKYWLEFGDGPNSPISRQKEITEQELRARLPEDRRKAKLKLSIKSIAGGSHEVEDFATLASKASRVKLPNGQMAFRSSKFGLSQMDGSTPEQVVLHSAIQQTKLLTQVRFYHGNSLDGVEFFYEDATSQLFGKRGGTPGGSEFNLDTRKGEYITGFYVRSGFWIDGLAVITSLGRKSNVYGNPNGGSGRTLMPPRGYGLVGVYGSQGAWVDGFGILISR